MIERRKLLTDERGIATTEYLILIVLVAIAGFAAWEAFGVAVSEKIGPSSAIEVSADVVV